MLLPNEKYSQPLHSPSTPIDSSSKTKNGLKTTNTTVITSPAQFPMDRSLFSWIPSDGCISIIRSVSCGGLLTLLDGEIILAPLSGRGSIHWTCVEFEGWFGFRNTATSKFLCHVRGGKLKCTAGDGEKWRHFTITPVAGKGYIMQMCDWWVLKSVIAVEDHGKKTLGRWGDKLADGVVWGFIQV
ncbi:hypothetical protein DE146DRAFT_512302 [Phaeosphaeria sp. MPI-PUGE-AT-0046c]|nr:hypothetical protein DE146DRAFT_512302 [Phaeosphaeria sp. MPI-PUGE-AT-0046c]